LCGREEGLFIYTGQDYQDIPSVVTHFEVHPFHQAIGYGTFVLSELTTLNLDELEEIGDYAFQGCHGYVKSSSLPPSR
jgi:hypothetical protein